MSPLRSWLALEGPSRVVKSIFSIQLPTPFHHNYFHEEMHAPLRLCEMWPRLNSCSRSVQSKGTPTGAYLTHPSIKAEAKARKQVHDSFSLKLLSSSSGAPPRHPNFHISSNGGSSNEAPNGRVVGGCPCSSPLSYDAVTRRGGQLGGATTGEPIPAFGYLR